MPSTFTTQVEVANLALEMLGANTISSFEESSRESQLMKRYYELWVKTALNRHDWRFCITDQQASLLASSPISQWAYGYELPSDMLELRKVFVSDSAGDRSHYNNYEIFADNTLCTDVGTGIWVHYKQRVYETRWPAYFIDYVGHHIAIKLCPMMGRQFDLQQQLINLTYGMGPESVFTMACFSDSQQYTPEEINLSYLQGSRESY